MKKIAIILAIAMLVCAFASCAKEKQDFTSINDYVAPSTTHKIETGTLSFKDVGGEFATITDYVGLYEEHSVVIPAKVGDEVRGERTVTAIDNEAFYYTTSAKSIIIPNTVTSIGDWAFAGCTSLETIVIPASVTSIGKGAFMGCTALKSVVFEGEELTSISEYTFMNCTSLESINVPKSVMSIGTFAFNNCEKLAGFTASESLKSIGDMAFYGCTALNSDGALTLSASIEKIGEFAFSGINKEFISAPADSYAAKYVAEMRDDNAETEETTDAE